MGQKTLRATSDDKHPHATPSPSIPRMNQDTETQEEHPHPSIRRIANLRLRIYKTPETLDSAESAKPPEIFLEMPETMQTKNHKPSHADFADFESDTDAFISTIDQSWKRESEIKQKKNRR